MEEAARLADKGMRSGEGGPFGAVVVKNGEIIGRGWNRVLVSNDPTAHAEINAIREACSKLNSFQLDGCEIYTTCEPCPMCLGAIYWARPEKVFFASNRLDAAAIGFDDQFIYYEINIPFENRSIPLIQEDCEAAKKLFNDWTSMDNKSMY